MLDEQNCFFHQPANNPFPYSVYIADMVGEVASAQERIARGAATENDWTLLAQWAAWQAQDR